MEFDSGEGTSAAGETSCRRVSMFFTVYEVEIKELTAKIERGVDSGVLITLVSVFYVEYFID